MFWGCNPVQAHPRNMSRYSTFSRGFFTEKGRKGRKIIALDVRKTHTAGVADEYYNPGETAANDVLYRKEVDAAMIIAADAAAHFPANSVRQIV